MPWRIRIAHRAERDLARLPPTEARRVLDAIHGIALNPGSAQLAKLEGGGNRWRLRVGTWRVLLDLDNRAGLITVTRVLDRRDAYRR